MRKKNSLEYFNNIDDRFLMESWEECRASKSHFNFFIKAAAAVLIILLSMGTAAYAAKYISAWISEKYSADNGSGYNIKSDNKLINQNELHGKLGGLKNIIINQYKNYDTASNQTPGYYQKSFNSKNAVKDFIGYDKLVLSDWKYKTSKEISMTLEGNEDGSISNLDLESYYDIDNIRLQEFESMYFEGGNMEPDTLGNRDDEFIEYSKSNMKSKYGAEWLVVDSSKSENGYFTKTAYISKDGVMYQLYMVWEDDNKKKADALMIEWINAFKFN